LPISASGRSTRQRQQNHAGKYHHPPPDQWPRWPDNGHFWPVIWPAGEFRKHPELQWHQYFQRHNHGRAVRYGILPRISSQCRRARRHEEWRCVGFAEQSCWSWCRIPVGSLKINRAGYRLRRQYRQFDGWRQRWRPATDCAAAVNDVRGCVVHKPRRNASGLRVTRTAWRGTAVLRTRAVAAVAIGTVTGTAVTVSRGTSTGTTGFLALALSFSTALALAVTLRTTLTTAGTRRARLTVEGVFKAFRIFGFFRFARCARTRLRYRYLRFKTGQYAAFNALTDQAFNAFQVFQLFRAHQRNGFTGGAVAAGTANAVHIVSRHVGQFEVHHMRQLFNIQTTSGDIVGHQPGNITASEFGQCAGTGVLTCIAMNGRGGDVVFLQVFRQAVSTVLGTGKYQHLLPLVVFQQLAEQLRLTFFIGRNDPLLDTVRGAVTRADVDFQRIVHQAFGQGADFGRERSGKQQVLPLFRQQCQNFFNVVNKAHVEHTVGFVQHQELEIGRAH